MSDYRVDKLVADLVALLDALNIGRVRLVAHDWGAVIGWRFVLAHPERIERYVALSVGIPMPTARVGSPRSCVAITLCYCSCAGLLNFW